MKTYQTILLASSVALLSACGGSNSSTSVPSPQTPVQNSDVPKEVVDEGTKPNSDEFLTSEERNEADGILGDPKWRKIDAFLASNETDKVDPMKVKGKISKNVSAAAYMNGTNTIKLENVLGTMQDFYLHKGDVLAKTDFDAEFLLKGKMLGNELQNVVLHSSEDKDKQLGQFAFMNLPYSSYYTYKPVNQNADIMVGYVAVPTTKTDLSAKGTVTYKGHIIGNKDRRSNDFTLGDIEFTVDFVKGKVLEAQIAKREDSLLQKYGARWDEDLSWRAKEYTADQTQYNDDPDSYTLISKDKMDERIEKSRKLTAWLTDANISYENGVVSFNKRFEALGYNAINGEEANKQKGVYGGIFAGDNAQEIIGEIDLGGNRVIFGAREVTK